jgi:hypothetical protein
VVYQKSIAEAQAWVAAFREGFRKLGWTEGGDFQIDVCWAASDTATIARFATRSRFFSSLGPRHPQKVVTNAILS